MNEILTPGTFWILVLIAGVPICILFALWGFTYGERQGFDVGYERGKKDGYLEARLNTWAE
jgi:hypothetical protein